MKFVLFVLALCLFFSALPVSAQVRGSSSIVTDGSMYLKPQALTTSAGVLTVGRGTVFAVSGTDSITGISTPQTYDGRIIVLKFAGAAKITDGGSNLKTASVFVATADDVMVLVCISDVWYEIARSVN